MKAEFLFDFGSPDAHIAQTRIPSIQYRAFHGALRIPGQTPVRFGKSWGAMWHVR